MGNSSSIRPIKKNCESIECPICLEDHFKYITLNCGHKFDLYCIQMHIFLKYTNNLDINCPYCRTPISKKSINKIWNDWKIINYKYAIFSKNSILNINNKLNLNNINFIEYNTDINVNNILIPLFNGKPAFLITPIINDSNILYNDNVIRLSHNLSEYKSEFNESINKYNFIMDCYITDKKWMRFLNKISKSIKNKKYNIEINEVNYDCLEKIKYSEYKMRLYITDKKM